MQRYLRRFRHGRGHAPVSGPKPPTVREVTGWIMTHPDGLDPTDAEQLRQARKHDRELDRLTRLTRHVRRFATMMTQLQGEDLEQWITDVERDTVAPVASFAATCAATRTPSKQA